MSILRKIFKTGNSKVVSLPHYLLEELGLKDGEEVYVDRIYDKGYLVGLSIKPFAAPKKKQ